MKTIVATVFLLLTFASGIAHALAISASNQASSCNLSFPCGLPHVGGALADDFPFGPYVSKSAIEFSLAGLTEISNANLRFVATGFSSYPEIFVNDPVIEIHGYSGDGIVQFTDLSINNLLFTSQPITSLGVYTFDVTSYVATLVDEGATYAGFAVRNIMPNSSVSFSSSNTLVVNIPEPEQVWLMAVGLAVMLLRLKARHS